MSWMKVIPPFQDAALQQLFIRNSTRAQSAVESLNLVLPLLHDMNLDTTAKAIQTFVDYQPKDDAFREYLATNRVIQDILKQHPRSSSALKGLVSMAQQDPKSIPVIVQAIIDVEDS